MPMTPEQKKAAKLQLHKDTLARLTHELDLGNALENTDVCSRALAQGDEITTCMLVVALREALGPLGHTPKV